MRIGLIPGGTPGPLLDLQQTLDQVTRAERDGFSSYSFPHLSNRGYDVLTVIAIAGGHTSRIELGTGVVPTYPRHPLALAQQAMTVQAATNGRLTLGIGPSHKPGMENSFGLAYDRPALHIREYLTVLRGITAQGKSDFQGHMYRVKAEAAFIDPKPFPIIVSALAPAMLKVAGELSDGTITWMTGLKAVESHIVPRITEAARNAGRPTPRTLVGLPIAVTGNRSAAYEQAARTYGNYGRLINYRRVLDVEGADGPADVAVIGTEEQVERQLRAFAAAGATDFLAAPFPVDADPGAVERTWRFLASINGRV
jgi:F420-dependent oxidoreductase-like protein